MGTGNRGARAKRAQTQKPRRECASLVTDDPIRGLATVLFLRMFTDQPP